MMSKENRKRDLIKPHYVALLHISVHLEPVAAVDAGLDAASHNLGIGLLPILALGAHHDEHHERKYVLWIYKPYANMSSGLN